MLPPIKPEEGATQIDGVGVWRNAPDPLCLPT
jgi:hypothetical protein